MAAVLPIPPTGQPYIDIRTGQVNEVWQRYLLALQDAVAINVAPIDAAYWVSRPNTQLTNETNIGALATGFLYVTVAAGIATPSTTTSIPASLITSGQPLTRTNDTNVTLTLGGTPGTALLKPTELTLGWSGQLGLSRGGTNANLSATGGASQVLRQSSAGAAVTVSQLAYTDITGLASGTYTPTLTNVTNLDASTAYACQYLRVGSMVVVSGKVDVNPTALADTELGISLPIASNFATAQQCAGTGSASAVQQDAAILGDTTNDRAAMTFVATDTNNRAMYFQFGYQVL